MRFWQTVTDKNDTTAFKKLELCSTKKKFFNKFGAFWYIDNVYIIQNYFNVLLRVYFDLYEDTYYK